LTSSSSRSWFAVANKSCSWPCRMSTTEISKPMLAATPAKVPSLLKTSRKRGRQFPIDRATEEVGQKPPWPPSALKRLGMRPGLFNPLASGSAHSAPDLRWAPAICPADLREQGGDRRWPPWTHKGAGRTNAWYGGLPIGSPPLNLSSRPSLPSIQSPLPFVMWSAGSRASSVVIVRSALGKGVVADGE
jgi:hypothetical protein